MNNCIAREEKIGQNSGNIIISLLRDDISRMNILGFGRFGSYIFFIIIFIYMKRLKRNSIFFFCGLSRGTAAVIILYIGIYITRYYYYLNAPKRESAHKTTYNYRYILYNIYARYIISQLTVYACSSGMRIYNNNITFFKLFIKLRSARLMPSVRV